MNKFSITRLAGYGLGLALGVAAAGAAGWAAAQGFGTYDQATNMFDPAPINLDKLVAWASAAAVAAFGNGLAAISLLKGWTRK